MPAPATRRTRIVLLVLPGALALLIAAASILFQATPSTAQGKSAATAICADPDLRTFCRLVDAASNDAAGRLLDDPTFVGTIFAPTDAAFESSRKDILKAFKLSTFEDIFTTAGAPGRLLKEHIIPDVALPLATFKNDAKFKSLLGQSLEMDPAWFTKEWYIKSRTTTAKITQGDIPAGRAILHKINKVIIPYA